MSLTAAATKSPTIGFIGGGNMARSLIGGLVANGYDHNCICVSDPSADAKNFIAQHYRVNISETNQQVVAASDTVVLAVKPQVVPKVLSDLSDSLQSKQPLLISIAAGIRLSDLEHQIGGSLAISRVMPNTPALIQKGVSALYANSRVSDAQKSQVQTILSAVGKTVWLPNEDLLDAVTAISGSGPAYFFYLIESMEKAALELGLDSDTAHTLATETAVGAALLAAASDQCPATLRRQVTSPGGVTEAAIKVLETEDVGTSIVSAIRAGTQRSVEMSNPTTMN